MVLLDKSQSVSCSELGQALGSAAPEPTAVGAADSQLLCLGDLIPGFNSSPSHTSRAIMFLKM